jgi:glycosyltransferase involved in cell wall biosynthesis
MVVFSSDIFTSQRAGGVSRCMIELMRALDARAADYRLLVTRSTNVMIEEEQAEGWFQRHAALTPSRPFVPASLDNERALRKLAAGHGVVHRTYHPRLDLLSQRTRVVETLHDLWDQYHGDRWSPRLRLRSLMKKRALERADLIVCVSHFTQERLVELWPDMAARSVVIHHGARPFARCAAPAPAPAPADQPFFLYVGNRTLYKNFMLAVQALAAGPLLADHELVCFGGGAFTADEHDQIASLGLAARVRQVDGSDAALGDLYHSARALLYPSLHEGFGLPLLEAMLSDCPVVAAPLTSLPEVGGDAVLYADPGEVDAWTEGMTAVTRDDDLRRRLIAAGRLRAAQFSWDETARRHMEAYVGL